jgi:hypothetical protein
MLFSLYSLPFGWAASAAAPGWAACSSLSVLSPPRLGGLCCRPGLGCMLFSLWPHLRPWDVALPLLLAASFSEINHSSFPLLMEPIFLSQVAPRPAVLPSTLHGASFLPHSFLCWLADQTVRYPASADGSRQAAAAFCPSSLPPECASAGRTSSSTLGTSGSNISSVGSTLTYPALLRRAQTRAVASAAPATCTPLNRVMQPSLPLLDQTKYLRRVAGATTYLCLPGVAVCPHHHPHCRYLPLALVDEQLSLALPHPAVESLCRPG